MVTPKISLPTFSQILGCLTIVSDEPFYSFASTPPDNIENDIFKLTTHLVTNLETDRDKAKVIFFWIAQNIEYDLEAYYEDIYFDNYQETLDRKRGICKNYSNLFMEMCKIANIDCYEISGYGKGYDFEKGAYFEKVNHSWNVILIDSVYYFCDITWGSGIFESKEYGFEYAKRLNMRYFLQEPAKFLIDHLPSNPDWQLIENPISMEDFIWNNYRHSDHAISQKNTLNNSFLEQYKSMDDADRVILDYENSLKYYYSDYLSEVLGIYCYDIAYNLSTQAKSKEDHLKAVTYYNKSIKALNNIVISYPQYKNIIENARNGIIYSEYQSKIN